MNFKPGKTDSRIILPLEQIERRIFLIRGYRVMLDSELARLFGVTTARLNQQVRRNIDRFPKDFMFELSREEFKNLMLQFATSSSSYGGRRNLPRVFTEHGAVMLASVLHTPIAVQASIQVVRAFLHLREMLSSHKELAQKLDELEGKFSKHDGQIRLLFEAIRELMTPPPSPRKKIGFHAK